MTALEIDVVLAWRLAAKDLGLEFTSPFSTQGGDGVSREYLGIVRSFGRKAGALFSVMNQPSQELGRPKNEDFFYSILGAGYSRYDRQSFIDTLNDWGYFGPDENVPSWYTGKSWS